MGPPNKENDGTPSDNNPAANTSTPPREFNPRSGGYLLLCCLSLALFASITDVNNNLNINAAEIIAAIVWGVLSFILSLFILLFDRVTFLNKYFDLKNLGGEKKHAEGYLLLALTVFWIGGVGFMTSSGGVAYAAMNTYFMSWGCLFCCVYILNEWAAAKDIISVRQLTHLSATLPGWYVLFLSSLVEMFSAADQLHSLKRNNQVCDAYCNDLRLAIYTGVLSTVISFTTILIHYKIISFRRIQAGDLIELGISIFLVLWWIVAVSILTQINGVAATLVGHGCPGMFEIPGSNLYVFTWANLFASIYIVSKWNAARAMQFAMTEERIFSDVTMAKSAGGGESSEEEVEAVKGGNKLETVPEDDDF